ncbi:hypothetical protein AAFF_G00094850 [Aldrovandia affinis]|uniref:Uncharacterized protein n=1 Tax=Aldrovandia affinis TaxID=143900 RepID=A0AAD7RW18_9TELE|nr:hypothetical protein AAFF_G00094850 [Aldrovandia affinis]
MKRIDTFFVKKNAPPPPPEVRPDAEIDSESDEQSQPAEQEVRNRCKRSWGSLALQRRAASSTAGYSAGRDPVRPGLGRKHSHGSPKGLRAGRVPPATSRQNGFNNQQRHSARVSQDSRATFSGGAADSSSGRTLHGSRQEIPITEIANGGPHISGHGLTRSAGTPQRNRAVKPNRLLDYMFCNCETDFSVGLQQQQTNAVF